MHTRSQIQTSVQSCSEIALGQASTAEASARLACDFLCCSDLQIIGRSQKHIPLCDNHNGSWTKQLD